MKTTLQVVTDKQERIFHIDLLTKIGHGSYEKMYYYQLSKGRFVYDPIEIEVDDKLYNWFCEWILCIDRFKRDIIIGNTKLIGCYIISLDSNEKNTVKLNFNLLELI